ncbi:kinase-like protein [Daldinia caldariorum]|uniref:kinase-like protein n=1 Tax=Daldinia caldariorum TaxID=326644 RepID=UPI002007C18E|nr:kinase-like protein [Daldinia caldariorum]KAI1464522.1 kinase-like protein [Daldinia caldariorum]
MAADKMSDHEADREYFGSLADIPEESLVLLASDICKRVLDLPGTNGKRVRQIFGGSNIVNVIQLDEIQLVIRLTLCDRSSDEKEAAAAGALESQVATMRFIAQNTSIPVPQVYDFDTDDDNVIGTPYICMSFVPGTPVSQVWIRDFDVVLREQLRLRILKSLAGLMAQLSQFTFDKIGAFSGADPSSASISECYAWGEGPGGLPYIEASGPFDTAAAYLEANHDHWQEGAWDRAERKILEAAMSFSAVHDEPTDFVLCHPNLDSHNVMVDPQGNITGLLGWDMAMTTPRCLGYAAYPSWIVTDWDPLIYAWPYEETEDSPESLSCYRAYYSNQLGREMDWEGDWRFTKYSHIVEAVWIAFLNRPNRLKICLKLVQFVLQKDKNTALDVLGEIGEGFYEEEDWDDLETKLRRLLSQRSKLKLDMGDMIQVAEELL